MDQGHHMTGKTQQHRGRIGELSRLEFSALFYYAFTRVATRLKLKPKVTVRLIMVKATLWKTP